MRSNYSPSIIFTLVLYFGTIHFGKAQERIPVSCGTTPPSKEYRESQNHYGNNRYLLDVLAKSGLYLPLDYFESLSANGLYKNKKLSIRDVRQKPATYDSLYNKRRKIWS